MRIAFAGAMTVLVTISSPVGAEEDAESPNLVTTFTETCLMQGVDHADRVAVLENGEDWQASASVTYDVANLQPSRAIGAKPRFKDYTDVAQWDGVIDGRKASFMLVTFKDKSRYKNACVLMVEGLRNALPYGRGLRAAFKAFGAGGKSVDLAHYYEFAGTLKPGKQPVEAKHKVHGELFTRSQAGSIKETAHIYVAY